MDNVYFKIIIPNYNNEKYIEKCLLSIQQQTFKDYKVILIDDMSTDSSFDIAKKFEKDDPQHFVCIKAEKKSYQGICRNIGIEYPVQSKYTWFIDADDYIPQKTALEIYKQLTEQYPDIEMFAFDYEEDRDGNVFYKVAPSIRDEIHRGYFCILGIMAPWARIYKTESIKDLRYRTVLFEDMLFLIEYLDRCPKIAECHHSFYRYRINSDGDTLRYQRKDPVYVKRYQEMLEELNLIRNRCHVKALSLCIDNRLSRDMFKSQKEIVIASRIGGRLANQLYFVLQAFVNSRRKNISYKYEMTQTYAPAFNILLASEDLNIGKYLTKNKHISEFLSDNSYYQTISKDYTEEELSDFINETILKSKKLKDSLNWYQEMSKGIRCASIHIRNTDYLTIPMFQCFDREKYIRSSLNEIGRLDELHVYSDDIEYTENTYGKILSEYAIVKYMSTTLIDDFIKMSVYQNKILWNSTFSYWTAYISTVIYGKNNVRIICPKYSYQNSLAINRGFSEWTYINS